MSCAPASTPGPVPVHIAVVDDDPEIRHLLGQVLERYGFRATAVADGPGLRALLAADPSVGLIVLDLMLPGEDGLSVCQRLRQAGTLPVIMLTARAEPVDRVVGLEVGADDYLAKPFDTRELVARIRSVLRRTQAAPGNPRRLAYRFEGWTLDLTRRELRNPDQAVVSLSSLEYRLLELLLGSAGTILTRDQLMEALVGRPAEPFERRIDIAVSRLRERIGDCGREPRRIKTVRNRGYVFACGVERQ